MKTLHVLAVVLCCSVFVFSQADFASGPAVSTSGGRLTVTFSVSASTDVEVAVLDASGKIVRHLAAGVLGGTNDPPAPLAAGLTQSLTWDGLDDFGGYPPSGDFRVRVRLGVAPVYDTTFDCHDIWPAGWQYYPGGLNPQETVRPASDPFLNLLSYTGTPLYEQEHRLEVSASDENDVLLVDGCDSDQGLGLSAASVFCVNGTTGRVEKIINGNTLNFGASSHYPGQGKAVYTLDGKYYLYRCADNVYRFDLNGQPAPWPGTGSHIVTNLSFNDIGSAGITPGYDGSVYVVHYPDASTINPQYVSKIVDGVVVARGLIKVNGSLAGGVRVDKEGNIYVGARVRDMADPYPDDLDTAGLSGGLCESRSQRMWADEMYGSILKFGPAGGSITADQAGPLEGGSGIYPDAACQVRVWDKSRAVNLIWMHKGLSHVLLHTTWRITKCWCNQTRFSVDKYGRIFYPNTFMNEFVGMDNNRNTLFKVRNRDLPQVAMGVGHQIETSDKALFVADFYNTQIIRFDWGADQEWTSQAVTGIEEGVAGGAGIRLENFPNPFNPETRIRASVKHQGPIMAVILDVDGRVVKKIATDAQGLKAGVAWNGTDMNGRSVKSGVYIARVECGNVNGKTRLLLVR